MRISFSHLGEGQEPALVVWLGGKEKDLHGAQIQNCRFSDRICRISETGTDPQLVTTIVAMLLHVPFLSPLIPISHICG